MKHGFDTDESGNIRVSSVSHPWLNDFMQLHAIRLRGPWQCGDRRITMPCTWDALPAPSDRRLRLLRRFHQPTGITADLAIWLVVEGCLPGSEFLLNGTALGSAGDKNFAVEVTGQLRGDNELTILTLCPAPGESDLAGPFSEVRLEIREKNVP
jgi:hypothetical protein